MKKFLSYIFILIAASGLGSCADDIIFPDMPDDDNPFEGEGKGYALNFTVTLDNMGGMRSRADNPQMEIENYINPEKFRVLFFDNNDKFLFESKSRWVKRRGTEGSYTEWFVSVPFYSIGNDADADYDWNWDSIRHVVTHNNFKIAILANRPEIECYPDLTKLGDRTDDYEEREAVYFNNSGPFWTKVNSVVYEGSDKDVKDVFDLHHAQNDPIYTHKGMRGENGAQEGYYEFVMGVDPKAKTYGNKLMLSSTSCWIDHGPTFSDDGKKFNYYSYSSSKWTSNNRRRFRMPTQEYPIPMYGIQEFDTIKNWMPGTPFNLSDITANEGLEGYSHHAISLLRSVVKLELRIPKTYEKPTYICVRYPNVYARCEPMDVWTSTGDLWSGKYCDETCEWQSLMNYGAIASKNVTPTGGSAAGNGDFNSFRDYRNHFSWIYGSWEKFKKWKFNDHTSTSITLPSETTDTPYPRLFNPCVQRNLIVMIDPEPESDAYQCDLSDKYNDNYWHYVCYVGERNVNHPSDLYNVGATGSGKATVIYWMFNLESKNANGTKTNYIYSLPIVDYDNYNPSTYTQRLNPPLGVQPNDQTLAEPGNTMGTYEQEVMQNPYDQSKMPWPLLRNHVYTITVGPAARSDGQALSVSCEDKASPTITFK